MKVSDILAQKIAEIESRLPVKLKGSSKDSFASVLGDSMTSQAASNAPIIDSTQLESSKSSNTKYPLVSGSYESVYPGCHRPKSGIDAKNRCRHRSLF